MNVMIGGYAIRNCKPENYKKKQYSNEINGEIVPLFSMKRFPRNLALKLYTRR